MSQPIAPPEAPPRYTFEEIGPCDQNPNRVARLCSFIIARGLGACVGYLLLALLCLGLVVAEVWGAWIICDLMGHGAVHQWREWHHG